MAYLHFSCYLGHRLHEVSYTVFSLENKSIEQNIDASKKDNEK